MKADVPPASADVPAAYLRQPLGPWDFTLEPLPDVEMEPISPELLAVEALPQPVIPMIELSATTSRGTTAASPLYPEYHPEAAPTSWPLYQAEPSHRGHCI